MRERRHRRHQQGLRLPVRAGTTDRQTRLSGAGAPRIPRRPTSSQPLVAIHGQIGPFRGNHQLLSWKRRPGATTLVNTVELDPAQAMLRLAAPLAAPEIKADSGAEPRQTQAAPGKWPSSLRNFRPGNAIGTYRAYYFNNKQKEPGRSTKTDPRPIAVVGRYGHRLRRDRLRAVLGSLGCPSRLRAESPPPEPRSPPRWPGTGPRWPRSRPHRGAQPPPGWRSSSIALARAARRSWGGHGRRGRPHRWRSPPRSSSLTQFVLGAALAATSAPATAHLLYDAVNRLDGVRRSPRPSSAVAAASWYCPCWLRYTGIVLAITITASGVADLLLLQNLANLAIPAGVLLLVFITGTGIMLGTSAWKPRRDASSARKAPQQKAAVRTRIDFNDGLRCWSATAHAEIIGFARQTIQLGADSSSKGGRLSTERVTLLRAAAGPHHHANRPAVRRAQRLPFSSSRLTACTLPGRRPGRRAVRSAARGRGGPGIGQPTDPGPPDRPTEHRQERHRVGFKHTNRQSRRPGAGRCRAG